MISSSQIQMGKSRPGASRDEGIGRTRLLRTALKRNMERIISKK